MKDLTVSVARGLAIIFMVIGHAGCWPWLYDFLYKFHMPIFFFVSGYCFKEKYLNDSKTFIFHRFKGLWWPYVKWMLVFLLLHNIFFRINLYDESMTFAGHTIHSYELKELCVRAVRILFMRQDAIEPYLGPLWLMPYFLVTSILGFFTIKFSRNIFLGAGFWLVVSMLLKFMSISIPIVGFDWVYAFYLSIFLLGFLFKSINRWANIFEIILIFVVILIVSFYLPTELYYTPNMFLIYVVALLGIYMTMSFSHCLVISDRFNSVKFFFSYCGDQSLQILIWHMLAFKLVALLYIIVYNLPIVYLAKYPSVIGEPWRLGCSELTGWWCPLYVAVGIVIPLIFVYKKSFEISNK